MVKQLGVIYGNRVTYCVGQAELRPFRQLRRVWYDVVVGNLKQEA
jgi:hypothetical protein